MKKNLTFLICILFFFQAPAQSWQEQEKLVPADRSQIDIFGSEMAMSGKYMIVSAPFDEEDANGGNPLLRAGSVYIFERDGINNWNEVEKLTSAKRKADMRFGLSVDIGGDYAIVGSPSENIDGQANSNGGIAYVFARDLSGNWAEMQKLVPADGEPADAFGGRVAINNDYAVVSASNEDGDTLNGNHIHFGGSVYIFSRTGDTWTQSAKITSDDIAEKDGFGGSVAISGETVLVLAPGADTDENGENFLDNAGAAYIFAKGSGNTWNQSQKIVTSDRIWKGGPNLTLDLAENALIIGDHNGGTDESGTAYIFSKSDSGVWAEVKKAVAPDQEAGAGFGGYVSISGKFALIGSPLKNAPPDGVWDRRDAGAAYVFERDFEGNWDKVQTIVASDRTETDEFGGAVAISGNYLAVGANLESEDANGENTLIAAGSVYAFQFTNVNTLTENISPPAIEVYPNPGKDIFWMEDVEENLNFKVFDLQGRLLKQGESTKGKIDLSTLEAGVYFLTVLMDGTLLSEKIMIQ